MALEFTIGPLEFDDLARVIGIEKENPSPWSKDHLQAELLQPAGRQYVARRVAAPEVILGYICCRTVIDQTEIFRLAVVAEFRRQGVGRGLLVHLLTELRQIGVRQCFLEFRRSNMAARKLYEGLGFKETGCRKNYYNGPLEDAILMAKKL